MADDKVVRFPVKSWQRRKNRLGKRAVLCEVTDRWLQFPEDSYPIQGNHLMFVDVMTATSGGKPKKICRVCISKEDLERAIKNVA
jgi:hypothetical protein